MIDELTLHDWILEQIALTGGTRGGYWRLEAFLRLGDEFELWTPDERRQITFLLSTTNNAS